MFTSVPPPPSLSIPVEQHPTLVLSFVMLLLTIMLCAHPQLLFPATPAASINKEQQSRQAMGVRHKAIIRAQVRASKGCSCLPYKAYPRQHLAHGPIQSRALATLTLQSVLYWQLAIFSHSCPTTYTCLARSLKFNSTSATTTSSFNGYEVRVIPVLYSTIPFT